jgi:hypothetical protein
MNEIVDLPSAIKSRFTLAQIKQMAKEVGISTTQAIAIVRVYEAFIANKSTAPRLNLGGKQSDQLS